MTAPLNCEPPRPLRRQLPPAEAFPVDALGSILGPAAQAIHDHIQAPLAICCQSVMAAATLAVQAHADLELPIGQTRPISSYFISIAQSGERKTTADNTALTPVRAYEQHLHGRFLLDQQTHETATLLWEKDRKRVLADDGLSAGDKEQAFRELGLRPRPPLEPMLTCPEPTYEGLVKLFTIGYPSLGLFSSEGGQFLGGFGMSADNRLKTSAALSSLWDGEPLRRVRAGDGSSVLPGRRLSMSLLLQPGVASTLLADPLLNDQGMLSRVLAVAPDSLMGQREWVELLPDGAAALQLYEHQLATVLSSPLPLKANTRNELEPRVLSFSPEARERWIAFSNAVEGRLGPGREFEEIRPFAAKAAEHAARLGAVLALVDDLACACLDLAHLEAGIVLIEHYLSEWCRLHNVASTSSAIQRAQLLLHWLETAWNEPVIGLPEIYQLGPNSIREASTARSAVNVLVDHGWLRLIEGGAQVHGVSRREAWKIIREA